MDEEKIRTALMLVGIAESGEVLNRDQVRLLGECVRAMSDAIPEEVDPPTSPLDDAARYLRALWPQGARMMLDTENAGCAWLRWEPRQGPVMSVSVPFVEGEAPSDTLARLVARLREMAVAERDAAEARATTLRAAIGGES